MTGNDFSSNGAIPTYPGHIYGIRAFAVQRSNGGVLSPQQTHYGWGNGVNDAFCPRAEAAYISVTDWTDMSNPRSFRTEHQVAGSYCFCGFYAYFDPSDAYSYMPTSDPGVLGIIRAHGRVTVGDDGFRAEHAEIVCFVRERPPVEPAAPKPPKMTSMLVAMIGQVVALIGAGTFMVTGLVAGWPLWLSCGVPTGAVVSTMYGGVMYRNRAIRKFRQALAAWNRAMQVYETEKRLFRQLKMANLIDHHTEDKLGKMFPNVPIYYDLEQALADFPLTRLEESMEHI